MRYAETKSFITMQRNFRRLLDTKNIKAWFDKFLATGSILKQSGGSRRSASEEKVEEILTAFQRNPSKSIRQTWRELYNRRDIIRATSGSHVEVY
jgi:hypothetical protein